ncbi:hypothetical protein BG005_010690 [Podila minutissima]|nr:hypothetical protein BG005_010690 [Podila minutissima]
MQLSPAPISLTSCPIDIVFSIPELADHIARCLRASHLRQLRLVSKRLYCAYQPQLSVSFPDASLTLPTPTSADSADEDPRLFGVPTYRIRSISLTFDDKPTAGPIVEVLAHHPHLSSLQIDFHGYNLRIFETAFVHTKDLVSLTVVFHKKVVIDNFLKSLMAADLRKLHTLVIDCKETGSPSHADWQLFRSILEMTEGSLTTLKLAGMLLCPKTYGVFREPIEGEEDGWTTGSVSLSFPRLQSLTLKNGELSLARIKVLHQLFPQLHTLELDGCSGDWLPALMEDPLPEAVQRQLDQQLQDHALFPELRSLKVWLVFQSGRKRLLDMVLGRKHLYTLGTDILPMFKGVINELADHCSTVGHRFTHLTVQTYITGGHSIEELEKFYNAECFRYLQYVFMQTWDHTINMFPFAGTLTSLHLGGKADVITSQHATTLNEILKRLPLLEVLIIERLLQGYAIFDGLGRDVATSLSELEPSDPSEQLEGGFQKPIPPPEWIQERPFLHELQIYACPPARPPTTGPIVSLNDPLDLDELHSSVVQRFRFLEKLKVKTALRHKPREHRIEPWKATLPTWLDVDFSMMK